MLMKWRIALVGLITLFFSCEKKSIPASEYDVGYDYYPQTIGKYVIYVADSTIYDEFTFAATTYKYLIKEKIEEEFTDPEGKPALRLVRYIKKYDSTKTYDQIAWAVKDAWQVNVSATSLEVVEENVRFTKLAFPVKTNASWNGNAKNTLGEWMYSYKYMDKKETINATYLDKMQSVNSAVPLEKVAFVKQKDFLTAISYDYYIEKYARGIGLVYREIKALTTNSPQFGVPIENNSARKGTIYKLTILSYGTE